MVMADLTDADLDAIEARLDAATPGPWHVEDDHATENQIWTERRWEAGGGASVVDAGGMGPADADLIAHAPNDLRALLAEVRRGRRIEAAARRVDAWMAQDRYTQLEKVDGGFDLRAALAEEPDEFRAALMEVTLQGRDIRVHWWHPDGYGARDNDGCLDT
jgi:hypothetical protein